MSLSAQPSNNIVIRSYERNLGKVSRWRQITLTSRSDWPAALIGLRDLTSSWYPALPETVQSILKEEGANLGKKIEKNIPRNSVSTKLPKQ